MRDFAKISNDRNPTGNIFEKSVPHSIRLKISRNNILVTNNVSCLLVVTMNTYSKQKSIKVKSCTNVDDFDVITPF